MEECKTPVKSETGLHTVWSRPYLCAQCSNKITNEEYIVTSDHLFYTAKEIFHSDLSHIDSQNELVSCVEACCRSCRTAVGLKIETDDWLLYREKIVPADNTIRILIMSLKKEECEAVKEMVGEIYQTPSEVTSTSKDSPAAPLPLLFSDTLVLTKSGLRNAEYHVPASNLVVLVHRCEGRILLTDRNGLYHDLLLSALKATNGNVLIFLTGNEKPAAEGELSNEDVEILAGEGGQPSLLFYKSNRRIMVWDTKPNNAQRKRISEALLNGYYRNELFLSTMNEEEKEQLATRSPLSGSLKKVKVETVFEYYNREENNEEIRQWAHQWKNTQSATFLNCSLL